MSADRLTTDPAGDVISARIQYLEEWIRDCQRYNQRVSAKLTAAEDRIRDLESLLAAKNAELRQSGPGVIFGPGELERLVSRLVNLAEYDGEGTGGMVGELTGDGHEIGRTFYSAADLLDALHEAMVTA